MNILGIWDGHDAGAAVIADGALVCAANEERFTRRKLEIRFPDSSIAWCLDRAGIAPADVNVVATCTSDVAKTLARWLPTLKESYYQVRRRQTAAGTLSTLKRSAKYWVTEWRGGWMSRQLSLAALRRELRRRGLDAAQLLLFDHHECHAHAAAWGSPYQSCAVVTVDGIGDGLSATVSLLKDGRLTRLAASRARDSLGVFFEHVTNLLNMRELEDEGKVMALSDYASAVPDDENPLLDLVAVTGARISMKVPGRSLKPRLARIRWKRPTEQFAYLAQRTVEHVCVQLARQAVDLSGSRRIALAGGVVSNVKANRRIRLLPEVDDVYVFPHMGDGGLAVGAALAAARTHHMIVTRDDSDLALGPEYSDRDVQAALERSELAVYRPLKVDHTVAHLLAAGRVVLWFQGRMEYGPRALGSRSILARPDRQELRERLNAVLKRRAWYQPFCPTMLESEARRLLSDYAGGSNRHMTMAYVVRDESRPLLSGVTSVDGSCRPHIVRDAAKGPFADLLREYQARTGLGVLLNTSFNIHGEPLVCTPEQAIDVYERTGADALAIGSFLVVRHRD